MAPPVDWWWSILAGRQERPTALENPLQRSVDRLCHTARRECQPWPSRTPSIECQRQVHQVSLDLSVISSFKIVFDWRRHPLWSLVINHISFSASSFYGSPCWDLNTPRRDRIRRAWAIQFHRVRCTAALK